MQVVLRLERIERPFDSIALWVDTEVKLWSGFLESKYEITTLAASVSVCSPCPDNSGLKLLRCVDWLHPLSFLVISFITYSQSTLAPLISLLQQGDVGCRWLMKNRIGFGVRQTECRHQSQNALIFNNPHLHVYKWYNQELLMLILPLPNWSWHRIWHLQTAWEARGHARWVWPCGGSSPDESSQLIKNTWRIARLLHRSLELIVVGQDEIWHDRSCLREDQTHQMVFGSGFAWRCFYPLCIQLALFSPGPEKRWEEDCVICNITQ